MFPLNLNKQVNHTDLALPALGTDISCVRIQIKPTEKAHMPAVQKGVCPLPGRAQGQPLAERGIEQKPQPVHREIPHTVMESGNKFGHGKKWQPEQRLQDEAAQVTEQHARRPLPEVPVGFW